MDHNKVSVHKNANKEKKELSQYAISAILFGHLRICAAAAAQTASFSTLFLPNYFGGGGEAWERDWSITAEV